MQALCELPTINQGYRNVFFANKKTRPPQKPESLLSKTFVVSENEIQMKLIKFRIQVSFR